MGELVNQMMAFLGQDVARVAQAVELVKTSSATGERWGVWLVLAAMGLATLWVIKVLGLARISRFLKLVLIAGLIYYAARSALVVWAEQIIHSTLTERMIFIVLVLGALWLLFKARRRRAGQRLARGGQARQVVDQVSAAYLDEIARLSKK